MTCFVRSRLTFDEFAKLSTEAEVRSITVSKLIRCILVAHSKGRRAELPQPRGLTNTAISELCRIGNNLNQLAKQVNTGLVAVSEPVLRAALEQVNAAARRLG